MDVFEFLLGKFRFIPPWLRNITYMTLLIVFVYLILGPRLITGQVVARTEGGGYVPYRGVNIQTLVSGHVLRFTTNEFGYWAIPVVNRLPSSIKIQMFHEDDNSWFPITINYADLWLHEFRFVVTNEAPFVEVEIVDRRPWTSFGPEVLAALVGQLVHPAAAGRLIVVTPPPKLPVVGTPDPPGPAPEKTSLPTLPRVVVPTLQTVPSAPAPASVAPGETSDEIPQPIMNSVREAVARATGANVSEVSPSFSFSAAGKLDYIKRIQVIESVEQRNNLKIPDEHWRSLNTVGELAEYVFDRKRLEEEFPGVKEPKNRNDWYEIQQRLPENLKLIFVPTK